MVEETVTELVNTQFIPLNQLIATDSSLQLALAVLIGGIVGITVGHYKFSHWIESTKFRYKRTHLAHIIQRLAFPSIVIIALIFGTHYIHTYELFTSDVYIKAAEASQEMTPREFFSKILQSGTILVSGFVIAKFIPVVLSKREKSTLEREDFERWVEMRGFDDDEDNFFYKLYKWNPPVSPPREMSEEQFKNYLKTEKGKKILERYRTKRGLMIGSYSENVKNPFNEWKKNERKKYEKYLESCTSGSNQAGRKLRLGVKPEEVYTIENWRYIKRRENYQSIIPGSTQPGHLKGIAQFAPKSVRNVISIGLFVSLVLGIAAWWEIDLLLIATASGGLSIAVGFALKETMENYFSYLQIRKEEIIQEGDRIEIEGYNGIVYKITPRVTYIKHGLNESIAIFPTHQLITSKIVNYSKDFKIVPAKIKIGVSYIHDPEYVTSILIKIGKRIMNEIKDERGQHMVVQEKCPYLEENLPSCGCDKDILVDIEQPTVRFSEFGDSSLQFDLWLFVRDYTSQFKVKSHMRMMIYHEFKKYGIKIPWPVKTVYQGDEAKEQEFDKMFEASRQEVKKEYGLGDLGKAGTDD